MEEIIKRAVELGNSKLVPAEQVIMTSCHDIDEYIVPGISGGDAQNILNALLSLFGANKGEYSVQCALYVATKVTKLFNVC